MELLFNERRILGVLLEKGFTTPEQYPLTLNAMVTAANQKSCRNPVTQLSEDAVMEAVDKLRRKGLCALVQTIGGRTNRWRHLVSDTLQMENAESALLAELLVRGPQTDGELRQNASRMVDLESMEALHLAIEKLRNRSEPLIVRLGPEERRRGVRYAHTFYPAPELEAIKKQEMVENAAMADAAPPSGSAAAPGGTASSSEGSGEGLPPLTQLLAEKIAALERRLDRIEKELGLGSP